MAVLIAVDPGLKSGLAMWVEERFVGSWILDVYEIESLMEGYAESYREDLIIICESFIINARTAKVTQAPWSLEIIGCLRYMSQKFCRRDLVMQRPAEAKSFSTNEKLKALGWYHRGTAGHDNDASRHLLLYTIRNGVLPHDQVKSLL
jgi:hypothetical protein